MARHRDGTLFQIELQIRVMRDQNHPVYALWISFDRAAKIIKEKKESASIVSLIDDDIIVLNGGGGDVTRAESSKDRVSSSVEVSVPPRSQIPKQKTTSTESPKPAISESIFDDARKYEDYKLMEKLGEGAFGSVHLARPPGSSVCQVYFG
jgi:hypothetical protein